VAAVYFPLGVRLEPELMVKMCDQIIVGPDELADYLGFLKKAVPFCRICGCTDHRACEGGCWWVEPDLCSSPSCVAAAAAAERHV
jgi:hypothetical protein